MGFLAPKRSKVTYSTTRSSFCEADINCSATAETTSNAAQAHPLYKCTEAAARTATCCTKRGSSGKDFCFSAALVLGISVNAQTVKYKGSTDVQTYAQDGGHTLPNCH